VTAAELLRAVRGALASSSGAALDEQCVVVVREIVALAETSRELLPTAGAVDACLMREHRNARIRTLSRRGVGVSALMARFGLSRRQVCRIIETDSPAAGGARTCTSVSLPPG